MVMLKKETFFFVGFGFNNATSCTSLPSGDAIGWWFFMWPTGGLEALCYRSQWLCIQRHDVTVSDEAVLRLPWQQLLCYSRHVQTSIKPRKSPGRKQKWWGYKLLPGALPCTSPVPLVLVYTCIVIMLSISLEMKLFRPMKAQITHHSRDVCIYFHMHFFNICLHL